MFTMIWLLALTFSCLLFPISEAYRPVNVMLNAAAYYSHPVFADALKPGHGWKTRPAGGIGLGSGIEFNHMNNDRFDFETGLPQWMNSTAEELQSLVFGTHVPYRNRPDGWPQREKITTTGTWAIEWKGVIDAQIGQDCAFVSAKSDIYGVESVGTETGLMKDGRREYNCDRYVINEAGPGTVQIYEIDTSLHAFSEMHVWMPDPSNPSQSLGDATASPPRAPLFHPLYLKMFEPTPQLTFDSLRMKDITKTDQNVQMDWIDRRLPAHVFCNGVLNQRSPIPIEYPNSGNITTDLAFEHVVALSNAVGVNLWINVPHLATDDFVRKMSLLILYGSDGITPYTSPTANPVWPPLSPNLKVYIEYSNEIWSQGLGFPQGLWAMYRGRDLNITKAQFNGRRFCEVWGIFKEVWSVESEEDRLVNVAATWTAMGDLYTKPFLSEMESWCPTLPSQPIPTVVSPATYFGNGIQDWIWEKGWWDHDVNDPFWQSDEFQHQQDLALDEWARRLLSFSAHSGSGPDVTGQTGGKIGELYAIAQNFSWDLPLVAYEGGPSTYTIDYVSPAPGYTPPPNSHGIMYFMEAIYRQPRFRDTYAIHANIVVGNGMTTQCAFFDVGKHSEFGQWGHREEIGQEDSVKWLSLIDIQTTFASIHPIDQLSGPPPVWENDTVLPPAGFGIPYEVTLKVSSSLKVSTTLVASSNLGGISFFQNCGDRDGEILMKGTPTSGFGDGYVFFRAVNSLGDPSWSIFNVRQYGHPSILFESDFTGTNLAAQRPWTNTFVLKDSFDFSFHGIDFGAGLFNYGSTDALTFGCSMGVDEDNSTFADTITKDNYFFFRLTSTGGIDLRKASIFLVLSRKGWHAPRRFAFFSSVTGFTSPSDSLFNSSRIMTEDLTEFEWILPDLPGFSLLTDVEFRIYMFGGGGGGLATSLTQLAVRLPDSFVWTSASVSEEDTYAQWCPGGPATSSTSPVPTSSTSTSSTSTSSTSPTFTSSTIPTPTTSSSPSPPTTTPPLATSSGVDTIIPPTSTNIPTTLLPSSSSACVHGTDGCPCSGGLLCGNGLECVHGNPPTCRPVVSQAATLSPFTFLFLMNLLFLFQ